MRYAWYLTMHVMQSKLFMDFEFDFKEALN